MLELVSCDFDRELVDLLMPFLNPFSDLTLQIESSDEFSCRSDELREPLSELDWELRLNCCPSEKSSSSSGHFGLFLEVRLISGGFVFLEELEFGVSD